MVFEVRMRLRWPSGRVKTAKPSGILFSSHLARSGAFSGRFRPGGSGFLPPLSGRGRSRCGAARRRSACEYWRLGRDGWRLGRDGTGSAARRPRPAPPCGRPLGLRDHRRPRSAPRAGRDRSGCRGIFANGVRPRTGRTIPPAPGAAHPPRYRWP